MLNWKLTRRLFENWSNVRGSCCVCSSQTFRQFKLGPGQESTCLREQVLEVIFLQMIKSAKAAEIAQLSYPQTESSNILGRIKDCSKRGSTLNFRLCECQQNWFQCTKWLRVLHRWTFPLISVGQGWLMYVVAWCRKLEILCSFLWCKTHCSAKACCVNFLDQKSGP